MDFDDLLGYGCGCGCVIIVIAILWPILAYLIGGFVGIFLFGGVLGLGAGSFYGVKSYWNSINKNITNKVLKITMITITLTTILLFILYMIAIIHFLISFYR